MQVRSYLFAALASVTPVLAAAQDACPGQTSYDLTLCAHEKWETADIELNRLWRVVKPMADARGTGATLLAEQRLWLKQRDAECEQELGHGGSLDNAIYANCMEAWTLRRNAELRAMQ